ncbi:Site-specific recombinase XerD [Streptomyces sp. 2323.1]|uniref:tyrosine-type recombinase/integrase n=1 Tax=Streptomyces sp. 2323.1 TaxID=1938841 RepID=UPI000BB85907|nr:tyrosine-type recombinase/integrase [Streptomyces sp. 2323.1]SOE12148.1 Site-specific recombinase XerD [Streptomyces sp. 2323.1]
MSWVVVDAVTYDLHAEGTAFLFQLRSRGLSVNTERTYGGRVALYLSHCAANGVGWANPTLNQLARFLHWLVDEPLPPRGRKTPLEPRFRSKATANAVLTTVCEFLRFGARCGWVRDEVVSRLSSEKYLSHLPAGYDAGEDGQFRTVRAREIKFKVEDEGIEWLTPDQVEEVIGATTRHRDRFLVSLLWVTGVRIGEALGLRREDMHFLSNSRSLGCNVEGPHLHVRRRLNTNGALAKSPRSRSIPVTEGLVELYTEYLHERVAVREAAESDMVFVNLFRGPLGRPMTYAGAKDLFDRLLKRVGFTVRPHMMRHSAATAWIREGQPRDVVQDLLGHQSPSSLDVYVHASDTDKRAAVERVAAARETAHE